MNIRKRLSTVLLSAALTFAGAASAGQLSIITDISDPGQPEALRELIARFEAANPDVQVDLTINGREDHKTAIRNFLQ
ncbi:MAG: carbohydrate ABC transporter substrate-binding protein, partial [Gammaproteobacteria bacterium]|nr:carbohydrate ABC transporter substrate-binding protein [Gammaproteobacteria bacterium]